MLAFQDNGFLQLLNSTGKSQVILAALTADSQLVANSYLAQDLGFEIWPVVDCSPTYDEIDLLIALQNLQLSNI